MGLFHHDNVMDWHKKNKVSVFATAKSRQKAEAVFQKCCQHSSQDQLLEYVFVDRCWFIPVALKYMDDEHLIQYACRRPAIETNGYISEMSPRPRGSHSRSSPGSLACCSWLLSWEFAAAQLDVPEGPAPTPLHPAACEQEGATARCWETWEPVQVCWALAIRQDL